MKPLQTFGLLILGPVAVVVSMIGIALAALALLSSYLLPNSCGRLHTLAGDPSRLTYLRTWVEKGSKNPAFRDLVVRRNRLDVNRRRRTMLLNYKDPNAEKLDLSRLGLTQSRHRIWIHLAPCTDCSGPPEFASIQIWQGRSWILVKLLGAADWGASEHYLPAKQLLKTERDVVVHCG